MKKYTAILVLTLLSLCFALAEAAENTYTMAFDGSDRWDTVLYDYNIDVDTNPGSAQLLKTELISDEMGNMTDATYDIVTGSIRAKKDERIKKSGDIKRIL